MLTACSLLLTANHFYMSDKSFDTKILHTSYAKPDTYNALSMPVYNSAAFEFDSAEQQAQVLVAMRYLDNAGNPSEIYPCNPNGSPAGITGVTTADGRFTIMMPHPERVFRTVQMSWHPEHLGEDSPWMRMFRNARKWVG